MPSLADHPSAIAQYRDASNLNARIALHARFSTNPYSWQRWVWDQLDLPAGSHVLELGCGPGDLWVENQDRAPWVKSLAPAGAAPHDRPGDRGPDANGALLAPTPLPASRSSAAASTLVNSSHATGAPAGWSITLSDLSPGMVRQARRNLGPSQERFRLVVANALALPFPSAAFDTIIANHMLYHVPDRPQALREIRRVLRPAGRLYATTVGLNHLRELEELVLRLAPDIEPDSLGTANPFTLESGGEQLAACFAHVTVKRYEDDLRVTAAEPLVAYILSSPNWANAIGDRVDRLVHDVHARLAADGVIQITKDSGLFVAW